MCIRDSMCIGYKWIGEAGVQTIEWDKYHNTEKMIEEFDAVARTADIIVGQNSDSFDVKHINTHRLMNNLPPLPEWFHMTFDDTKKMAQKYFNFPSNSLDYLSKYLLHRGGKKKMEFQDWIDILTGTPEAKKKKMAKMVS